jgi:ribonuclease BN (tRNA processing enzyme)
VRVILVPSCCGGDDQVQFLTSVLLNDTVAIDAGCLALYRSQQEQARVRHIFLSHSHLDHVATLPLFVNNTVTGKDDAVTVLASPVVLDSLRRDMFNDRVWPDFFRLSSEGRTYLRAQPIEAGVPVLVDDLRITPVEVNHVVPTFGFLVEDRTSAVLFSSDTGPTEGLWELANRTANLKAVFLEVTFANHRAWLASLSRHLTPEQFGTEVRKLKKAVPVFAVHISPGDRDEVITELAALGLDNVQVGRFGSAYEF